MSERSNRLFAIIQALRRARRPVTSADLAEKLEVTARTIYRDIAALQSMRVPIEGEAGIGYVMRAGFDLPPLMFNADEVEAIVVGMALLRRTGDKGLLDAAESVRGKIASVLPVDDGRRIDAGNLHVSSWGVKASAAIDLKAVRRAIRDEQKLLISYRNEQGASGSRTVQPLAIVYYVEVVVLAAWCERKRDFRHFRLDRITGCTFKKAWFRGQGEDLRTKWQAAQKLP
nr:YafY family protein [uncultured Dongia sp.]